MTADFIDVKEVSKMLGGRTTASIYRDVAEGRLPKPVKIGGSSRWLRDEIEEAIQTMIDARDNGEK